MSLYLRAELAVLLLHQEATRTGDTRLRIQQRTLCQWRRRNHIEYDRALGGYNIDTIIKYVTRRGARGHHTHRIDRRSGRVSSSAAVPPLCPESKTA